MRWENVKAQVLAGESPAGRFVPARSFEAIENLPNWKDWAPRFAVVYDLFGNGKTALKYSLNRYNQARTTGIAADYNPLRLADRDAAVARRQRRTTSPRASAAAPATPSVGCEIDFSTLPANFGTRGAERRTATIPRTWNLENAARAAARAVARTCRWRRAGSRGNFHNLTVSINQSWSLADYTPYTLYNPLTGDAVRGVRAQRRRQRAPDAATSTPSIPERKREYQAFKLRVPGSRPRAAADIRRRVDGAERVSNLHGAGRSELLSLDDRD